MKKQSCQHSLLVFSCLWLLSTSQPAQADLGNRLEELWESGQNRGQQLWQQITGEESWVAGDRFEETPDSPEQRYKHIWETVSNQLEQGLAKVNAIEQAPESSWFSADKETRQAELNEILTQLIHILEDQRIVELRKQIAWRERKIEIAQDKIIRLQEERAVAPNSILKIDEQGRDQFSKQIIIRQLEMEQTRQEIQLLHSRFLEHLKQLGLFLQPDQLQTLLARVDGDNIMQMVAIFHITKQLSQQLMALINESQAALTHAKRYYGMYVVLLELLNYIQNSYTSTVNHTYLPRIALIIERTLGLHAETKRAIRADVSLKRRRVYRKNMEAQDLTLRTARLYAKNLKNQRDRVQLANRDIQQTLKLAKNTYFTVQINAELMQLISQSQGVFDEIIKLQIPEIVTFENSAMQNKYQELSLLLQTE